MCQPRSEGGRRCADYERLSRCTAADFAPEPSEGVADVAWKDEDLRAIWKDEDGRASACSALRVMERAKAQEPEVTRSVMNVAASSGSECAHLEQRMKSPSSLVRKVRTEQESSALHGADSSAERIAGELKDVVRYTVVNQDHSRLATVAAATVQGLQQQGWTIRRIKNTYSDGSAYKGIHIIGTAPNGVTCEVQVHSSESLAVKNQNHVPYEIYRDASAPKRSRREARQECVRRSARIATPEGLDLLTEIGGVNVSKS